MMNKFPFNLLLAIFFWLASSLVVRGDPPLGCCGVIQLAASQVEDCSTTGEFQTVVVSALETATVTLQFDVSLAGTQLVVQALDGGVLGIGGSATIDQNGSISFPFQVGDQPGLYRVSVIAELDGLSVSFSLVQFQVPNLE
jgi:hypothetical protein